MLTNLEKHAADAPLALAVSNMLNCIQYMPANSMPSRCRSSDLMKSDKAWSSVSLCAGVMPSKGAMCMLQLYSTSLYVLHCSCVAYTQIHAAHRHMYCRQVSRHEVILHPQ